MRLLTHQLVAVFMVVEEEDKMKRKFITLLSLLICVPLASCGGDSSNGGGITGSGPVTTITTLPPNTPETFQRARVNTIENTEYVYTFALTAKIKFKNAISFSPAVYSGTTYYNENDSENNFLQERNISGALVIDSTNYIYNVGTDLVKISADESKDFSVIHHETVENKKDFDKNNFSYILKTLQDNDLVNVKNEGDKYVLSLKTNFSQNSLLGILNFIDSQTILKALNSYTKEQWGVSFNVNTWATLNDSRDHLKTFHFDASVVVQNAFEIGFEFEQNFIKYSGVTIVPPTFVNTITSETAVKSELSSISTTYANTKAQSTSWYNYDVKTAVDHGVSKANPLGLAVNSRTQGKAKREIIGETVYFNNRLEVDSDYKNADQYGDLVKDYNSYRARIKDGEDSVYDVYDPLVGFNQYTKIDDYGESAIDEYYMMPFNSLLTYDNIKVIKKTTDNSGNTTYKFGLSTDGVKRILVQYNDAIRIDYNRITIFDIYNIKSDFVAKKAAFVLVKDSSNKVKSIKIDLKGFYIENGSEDQVKFRLQNEIEFDWSKSYEAVTKKEDIDN